MDSQAAMTLYRKHIGTALQDFQNFLVSEMVHSWMESQEEGTLERLIAVWRQGMEERFEQQREDRMKQTGLIMPTNDAEQAVLDATVKMIQETFASPSESTPRSNAQSAANTEETVT